MVTQLSKYLPVKKELKGFALPLVLIVIIVLTLFVQEVFVLSTNRILLQKVQIEKELLNDLVLIGNKIVENLLIQKGTGNITGSGSFRVIVKSDPRVFLDMNGDGVVDSAILFSLINMSSTKFECALTAYILNQSARGTTTRPWTTMRLDTLSSPLINVFSSTIATQTQVSEYIQYSLKWDGSSYVIDKLQVLKKLNLVYVP